MLRKVSPVAARVNLHDGRLRDAVQHTNLALSQSPGFAQCADLAHLMFGQLGARMLRTSRLVGEAARPPITYAGARSATLLRSVCVVLCHGAGYQVRRVAARRIVTRVHNHVAQWRSAVRQVVRHAMGNHHLLLSCFWINPTDVAVAAPLSGSGPRPTSIGRAAFNAIPEACDEVKQVALLRHTQSLPRGIHA
jgi:hypothetical protein